MTVAVNWEVKISNQTKQSVKLFSKSYVTKCTLLYMYYAVFVDLIAEEFIVGRVIKALNNSWHPDCFRCQLCAGPLADSGFVKNAGRYANSYYSKNQIYRHYGCGLVFNQLIPNRIFHS